MVCRLFSITVVVGVLLSFREIAVDSLGQVAVFEGVRVVVVLWEGVDLHLVHL